MPSEMLEVQLKEDTQSQAASDQIATLHLSTEACSFNQITRTLSSGPQISSRKEVKAFSARVKVE